MRKISQKRCVIRRNGFTLIELLVVVAIIAVLMAILLPALNKAREQAKAVACASNVKSIGMGFHSYAAEWDGYMSTCDYERNTTSVSANYGHQWLSVSAKYLGLSKEDTRWVRVSKVTTCPSSTRRTGFIRRDYTLNMQMLKSLGNNYGYGPVKFTRYESPSTSVCLFDSGTPYNPSPLSNTDREPYPSFSKSECGDLSLGWGGYGNASTYSYAEMHSGKANVLFYDLHVENLSYSQIKEWPRYMWAIN